MRQYDIDALHRGCSEGNLRVVDRRCVPGSYPNTSRRGFHRRSAQCCYSQGIPSYQHHIRHREFTGERGKLHDHEPRHDSGGRARLVGYGAGRFAATYARAYVDPDTNAHSTSTIYTDAAANPNTAADTGRYSYTGAYSQASATYCHTGAAHGYTRANAHGYTGAAYSHADAGPNPHADAGPNPHAYTGAYSHS